MSHKFTLILLILILSFTGAFCEWHMAPVGKPWCTAVGVDSSGQRIVLGAANAGIWLSNDAGMTWENISSRFGTNPHVQAGSFKMYDATGNTIVALVPVQERCAWRTTDGGESWQRFGPPWSNSSTYDVCRSPFDSTRWFAVSATQFARSTDDGASWQLTNFADSVWPNDLLCDPSHDSTLYLASDYDFPTPGTGGLMRTTDLGLTWQSMFDFEAAFGWTRARIQRIRRLSNGDLILGVGFVQPRSENAVHILYSTDSGSSWNFASGVLPPDFSAHDVVEMPNAPGVVIASSELGGDGIYRSTDFGRTWSYTMNGILNCIAAVENLFTNRRNGRVYASLGDGGIYELEGNAETWQSFPTPSDIGCLTALSDQEFMSVSFWSSGAWYRDPAQSSWTHCAIPLPDDTIENIGPLLLATDTLLVAPVRKRGRYTFDRQFNLQLTRSTDHGDSWTWDDLFMWDSKRQIRSFCADRVAHFAALSTGLMLCTSYDCGYTWEQHPLLPSPFTLMILPAADAEYVVQDGYTQETTFIRRTIDRGATWEELEYPGGWVITDGAAVLSSDTLYVFGREGDSSRLYVWFSGVWIQRGTLPAEMVAAVIPVFQDGISIVALSTDAHTWCSSDAGFTWENSGQTLPFAENGSGFGAATFDSASGRIWDATGTGMAYLDLAELAARDGPLQFEPADYTILSAYPNPFNPTTQIRFDLLQRGEVKVDIYDLQGRLVQTLVDGIHESGRHEVLFDGTALASGTYFVRLHSPITTRTEKILLLK